MPASSAQGARAPYLRRAHRDQRRGERGGVQRDAPGVVGGVISMRAQVIDSAVHAARPISAPPPRARQRPRTIGHGAATASTAQDGEGDRRRAHTSSDWRRRAGRPGRRTGEQHERRLPIMRACCPAWRPSRGRARLRGRRRRLAHVPRLPYRGREGVRLLRTHDARGTIERIDKARRLNPDYRLDIAEARSLPPKQGKVVLERSLRREPENAELWVELSVIQARLGDFAGTARSYRRAQALAPRFLEPKKAPRRG